VNVVVDTSVIIAVIAGEPQQQTLVHLTKGADLIAPVSIHFEIGNALSAMLRRNRISLDKALLALAAYQQIPIRFVDIELDEALRIADAFGIYAYDAYLIRTALKFRAPLISLDRQLTECAKQMKVNVLEVPR
jgi:predicted nucleic acid-binding protein